MRKFLTRLKQMYVWVILITYPIVVFALAALLYGIFMFISSSAVYPM